eukprot:4206562-Pleurochrysis_carterae.AAC.1
MATAAKIPGTVPTAATVWMTAAMTVAARREAKKPANCGRAARLCRAVRGASRSVRTMRIWTREESTEVAELHRANEKLQAQMQELLRKVAAGESSVDASAGSEVKDRVRKRNL